MSADKAIAQSCTVKRNLRKALTESVKLTNNRASGDEEERSDSEATEAMLLILLYIYQSPEGTSEPIPISITEL